MSEEKLVPKLRFSGFSDDWESMKIGDCLDVKYGKDYKHLNEGQYPLLGTGGVMEYVDDFLYSGESILIGRKGTIDKPKYINDSFWTVDTLFYTEIKKQFPKFLFYCISNINWLKYNEASGVPSLSANNIKSVKINVPSLNEQKKIANFITSIDYKIELLEKKYESYVNFKKYLMQQIFAQKLRFDYDDEWKTMRLNEIVFYQEGPGVRNYQYTKKGVKLLNVGNFVKNVLNLDNTDRYISEDEAYGKYNHFLVDEGDLLIACSGIKAEYFDEKIAFAEKKHLPLCMNTSTMRFKSLDENILNLKYLKCYFQTESFKKQVFSVMTGSAQFNFGPTHLKYFKIPIPSIDEQKGIYKLFGSVDDKISMINQELDKVNEFKKSLLQQMFV